MSSTTASNIAARLRVDIDAGAWPPGSPLRQEDLATRYGASRIPVREALTLLRADGLVSIEPNRGAFVTQLTVAEVAEIFDLRVLLETDALLRSLSLHTPKSLLRLQLVQAGLEAEDSHRGWLDGDRAFHEALYAPSARARTLTLIWSLRAQVERYGLTHLTPGARRTGWAKEHQQLIAAVRIQDSRRATEVLQRHLRETQSAVCAAIDGGGQTRIKP